MNALGGSRVLITGGAGFIGSVIADQLLAEDVGEIVLLDNFTRGRKENVARALAGGKASLVEGDIRDQNLLNRLFEGIDYCFHMAALRINQCAAEPRNAVEVMLTGTYNVAEACIQHGIRKVVAASSASIYGTADTFPTKEEHHSYNNHTLYGACKAANEGMFRALKDMHGLDYNVMRYFNVFGPRMDVCGKYTEVLINWYKLIKAGERPKIYGKGDHTMDFVYVEDVARANILALKSDISDEAFNVASGVETSLSELCQALIAAMQHEVEPQYVPVPEERKKVEVSRRLADVTKAGARLGFEAAVELDDGLRRLADWLDSETERTE